MIKGWKGMKNGINRRRYFEIELNKLKLFYLSFQYHFQRLFYCLINKIISHKSNNGICSLMTSVNYSSTNECSNYLTTQHMNKRKTTLWADEILVFFLINNGWETFKSQIQFSIKYLLVLDNSNNNNKIVEHYKS